MSLKRLIWIMALAALSVLAVGAPVAQASHPDDTMAKAECVLQPGVAGAAALGGEDGVNSLLQDTLFGGGWGPLQLEDTDPGHFNFAGNAVCEGEDLASEDGNTGPDTIAPGQYEIIASGDFDNLICGTGTANGDAVIRGPIGTSPPAVQIFTEFQIKFAGGAGGGTGPPFTGKLVFVVDADETSPGVANPSNGQRPTAPDGAEIWTGSAMAAQYGLNGGHSYANGVLGSSNQIDGGGGTGDITITPDETVPGSGNCATVNVKQFLVNGAFEGFLSGEGSSESGVLDSDA